MDDDDDVVVVGGFVVTSPPRVGRVLVKIDAQMKVVVKCCCEHQITVFSRSKSLFVPFREATTREMAMTYYFSSWNTQSSDGGAT